MTKKKTKKPKLMQRRLAGLEVRRRVNSHAAYAHLFYEDMYDDGTVRVSRGNNLDTLPGFDYYNGGTKKQQERAKQAYAGEMYAELQAAAVLFEHITRRCLELDELHGIKEKP